MSPEASGGLDLRGKLALSISEAAKALGVSERHLRSHLHEIPHTHIGKRVVVPVDACREWLRDRARQEEKGADRVVDELMASLED